MFRTEGGDSSRGILHRTFRGVGVMVIVAMMIPLVVVLILSLNPGNELVFPPKGISLRWYLNIFRHPVFLSSFQFSMVLGVFSTLISLVIGLSGALVLTRRKFRGAELISSLLMSPLVVPQVVIGMSFLTLFSMMHVYQSVPSLFTLHIILTLPYTLRVFVANLTRCPVSCEEAAMVLGAGKYRAFVETTLPMIKPGIVAASIFSFVTSFDNITASQFLIWDRTTLPIEIYAYITKENDPTVAAVSGILILLTAGLVLAMERWVGLETVTG
jgi:putative spermidine/putrescine transport system permease protein